MENNSCNILLENQIEPAGHKILSTTSKNHNSPGSLKKPCEQTEYDLNMVHIKQEPLEPSLICMAVMGNLDTLTVKSSEELSFDVDMIETKTEIKEELFEEGDGLFENTENFLLDTVKFEDSSDQELEDMSIKKEDLEHILLHRDESKLSDDIPNSLTELDLSRPFKCRECDYITNTLFHLNVHQLLHTDPEHVGMRSCTQCDFKTLHKSSLNRHMAKHTRSIVRVKETKLFKCNECDYATKQSSHLKAHAVIHMENLEPESCPECNFKTKHKTSLRRHMLRHTKRPANKKKKRIEQSKTFKCGECDYRTKKHSHLKAHSVVHANPETVETGSCPNCNFRTKHKTSLRRHMVRHYKSSPPRVPEEAEMKSCPECSFTTRHKFSLKRHVLLHAKPFSRLNVISAIIGRNLD